MNCGLDILRLLKSSIYEPLNITRETRFDMKLMPTQTINLTISPFGKFHVKTPKHILKQLQRKFGHNEYNELHI